MLDDIITAGGTFDGEKGVVYSDLIYFSEYPSLLAVSVRDNAFYCEVYDNTDGIQCTDVLNIPLGAYGSFSLYSVRKNQRDFLVAEYGDKRVFYTVSDDTFTVTEDIDYDKKTNIISCRNGKITPYMSRRTLYNFLNSLKKDRIEKYTVLNSVNTISSDEKSKMLTIITACADIMDFDINNYDYNTLVKYILCTNRNFGILTSINPRYTPDSGGLSIVSMEYIDHILTTVFNITPEHPTVNSLVNRGFCTDNGYYYYKNTFTTFYATDIIGIEAVYNLGGNLYYTVFTDIYRQGDISFPEYSYAVLKKTDSGSYNLVKLGMGRKLLSERELAEIAPGNMRSTYAWSNKTSGRGNYSIILVLLLLVCVSCGAVALICGAVLIYRELTDK